MAIKTLYTAVGRFERRTNGCNRSCPIILLGGQEYMADMQEMVIWSMLNWRILRWDDIAQEYERTMEATNHRIYPDITTVMLFTPAPVADISSSTVREVLSFGRSVEEFMPVGVDINKYL